MGVKSMVREERSVQPEARGNHHEGDREEGRTEREGGHHRKREKGLERREKKGKSPESRLLARCKVRGSKCEELS